MADQPAIPQGGNETSDEEVGFFEMLADSPPALQEYLVSDDITRRRKAAYDPHALTEPEREEALYADLDVFFEQIPLEEFPDHLAIALPAWKGNPDRLVALTRDILGQVLLPAREYLGNVAELIHSLGGDPVKYSQDVLEMRTVSAKDAAAEIADEAELTPLPEDQMSRFKHIVESRFRNVRTDSDVLDLLIKPRKTGGLELSPDDANRVVQEIARSTRRMRIEDEQTVDPSKPLVSPQEIARIYAGPPEEQQEISKRINRFGEVTGGDLRKMRDAYYEVLYPADVAPIDRLYVVAGLLAFADVGEIEDLPSKDQRYRELIRKFYIETADGKRRAAEFASLGEDPTNPDAVNVLLQLLLRGFGGFSEAESARFGVRIINALKRASIDRLSDLAAFDMRSGDFRWADPISLE